MDEIIQYASLVTGVVYVVLAARNNIWCWLFGIISSALQIYVNIEQRLFQDAILQTYYIAAGFYGWWLWGKKGMEQEGVEIVSYPLRKNLELILLGCLLFPVCGYLFSKIGNSLSYVDAAVMIFSFIATWMTAKKIIENWLFWIVIDVVAGGMYFVKQVYPFSVLYLVFAGLAVYGYFEWRKKIKTV